MPSAALLQIESGRHGAASLFHASRAHDEDSVVIHACFLPMNNLQPDALFSSRPARPEKSADENPAWVAHASC
jgi:hypothetical protein